MMINPHYAEIISQAKARNATHVSFARDTTPVKEITPEKDTFTLSDRALAKMNGKVMEETAPTYVRPKSAQAYLSESASYNQAKEKSASDLRFDNIMQAILDKRLGIDREKLEELEAMMKEIADNENMTPEEKQKAMEKLEEMREDIIEESIEMKNVAKQTFKQDEKTS